MSEARWNEREVEEATNKQKNAVPAICGDDGQSGIDTDDDDARHDTA